MRTFELEELHYQAVQSLRWSQAPVGGDLAPARHDRGHTQWREIVPYKHAARHLLECQSLASGIQDYGTFETHDAFASRQRAKHGRKVGFWGQLTELSGTRR